MGSILGSPYFGKLPHMFGMFVFWVSVCSCIGHIAEGIRYLVFQFSGGTRSKILQYMQVLAVPMPGAPIIKVLVWCLYGAVAFLKIIAVIHEQLRQYLRGSSCICSFDFIDYSWLFHELDQNPPNPKPLNT